MNYTILENLSTVSITVFPSDRRSPVTKSMEISDQEHYDIGMGWKAQPVEHCRLSTWNKQDRQKHNQTHPFGLLATRTSLGQEGLVDAWVAGEFTHEPI